VVAAGLSLTQRGGRRGLAAADSSTRAVFPAKATPGHLRWLQWSAEFSPTVPPAEVVVPGPQFGGVSRAVQLPDPASASGTATLRVDRDAIPHLRRVFDSALSKLDEQIELAMSGVRVMPWAGDPVSENVATAFNNHSVDATDSALNALRAYQQRLKSASDALTQVAEAYRLAETGNATSFKSVKEG
jgi:hypothetical protein